MDKVFISAGIACLLAAIVGGGLKAFNVEIPVLRSRLKQCAIGLLGVIFIVTGFRLPLEPQDNEGLLIALENPRAMNAPSDVQIMSQVIAVIDKRLEGLGVDKANRRLREDRNRILITLNNIKFSTRLLELVSKPVRLEFRIRDDQTALQYRMPKMVALKTAEEQDLLRHLQEDAPSDDQVLFEVFTNKDTGKTAKRPVFVKKQILMTGDTISDAVLFNSDIDDEANILVTFNAQGARAFEEMTAANVGNRLAIILDGIVYSSPVVREKIAGGKATISGSFPAEEAKNIAIALRAGALPADLEVAEVRELNSGWLWKRLRGLFSQD